MAVAVDRCSLLIDQITESFRPVRNVLVAIGLFYSAKSVVTLAYQGFQFIYSYRTRQINSYTWYPRKLWSPNPSKYALVVLNTNISNQDRLIQLWNHASFRVLVDGAANNWFKLSQVRKENITEPIPDLITGDFDSINPDIRKYYEAKVPICQVIETPNQDFTDFTKALQQIPKNILKQKDIEEIYTFAEYGGRLDHIFGFFETLFQARNIPKLPPVFIVSSYTTDWLLQPGKHSICLHDDSVHTLKQDFHTDNQNNHCGIIPIGETCTEMITTGLKWNINRKQNLAFGTLVSTSNEFIDKVVIIETNKPVIWTMEN